MSKKTRHEAALLQKEDAQQAFLNELTSLTQKYGILIGGCGCCGSPWLNDEDVNPKGHYTYSVHNYLEYQ